MQRQTNKIKIDSVILTLEDIGKLYAELWKEYKKSRDSYSTLTASITSDSDNQYSFENTGFDTIKTYLENRITTYLKFELRSYSGKVVKNIEIELKSGNSSYFGYNSVRISSENQEWVSKSTEDIKAIIDSITPQNKLYQKIIRYLFHLIRLLLGYAFLSMTAYLLDRLGYNFDNTPAQNPGPWTFILGKMIENKYGKIVVACLLSYGIGLGLWAQFEFKLTKLIDETWPNIEFNFGPQHKRKAQNNKKLISSITSAVIIPLILSFIFRS